MLSILYTAGSSGLCSCSMLHAVVAVAAAVFRVNAMLM